VRRTLTLATCVVAMVTASCTVTRSESRLVPVRVLRSEMRMPVEGGVATVLEARSDRLIVRLVPRRDCALLETTSVERRTVETTAVDPASPVALGTTGAVLLGGSALFFAVLAPGADTRCSETDTDGACITERGAAHATGTILAFSAVPLIGAAIYQLAQPEQEKRSTSLETVTLERGQLPCAMTEDLVGSEVLLEDAALGFPRGQVDGGGRAELRLDSVAPGTPPRRARVILSRPSAGSARVLEGDLTLGEVELPPGPSSPMAP
jgi:hypothetical protein